MEEIKSKPKLHFFLCTNDRRGTEKEGMPSCGIHINDKDVKELKQYIREKGLTGTVQITRTGCLGYCHKEGCNIAVYPEGKIFWKTKKEEIKELIDEEITKINSNL